jgi:signal transduction histidine kinase
VGIQLGQWNVNKLTLKRVLDFLPYPFLISEVIEGVTYNSFVNRKFLEEIGYTIEDIPTISDWFNVAYPDEAYRMNVIHGWNELIRKATLANQESVLTKALIQTKHHGKKWYEVKSSLSGDIQLVAFVNIHEEISREEELLRLNENKNRTLAILSHDLRGPITNLHSLAHLALNDNLTQKEFVDTVKSVQEKTFQALEFLDTTLHWTRSNFDNISLKLEPIDLHAITRTVLKIYESTYATKNLTVSANLHPFGHLTSDAEIITIILRNLVSNAIKFTPDKGTIIVHVRLENDRPVIAVEDSGVGISEEMQQKIFSDHYDSQIGTRQEKGLGIGLRLCRELARKIDAQLEVQSKTGKGTTVRIVL